ncbi:MAG TPA: hypothetical protein VJ842_11870 [Pyrinomonadaceae bacterium]|nr:hypothetical protein [Pyrinomonadaceae bacterium]
MIRTSNVRTFTLLSALLLAVMVAACSSTGEHNAQHSTNAAASNNSNVAVVASTPSANSNQSGNNAAKGKLNLNTASGSDFLAAIPGLGNRMVHEFEEYRPYNSIQQFRREISKYVSAAQVTDYEKYLYVPINRNESDAATLQQIPGLDANEAQALIAARPYASNDAFLAKLAASVSEDELAVARTYLSNQ